MSDVLTEEIRYTLVAPKVQLQPFDEAVAKLRALRSEITAVNGALAGLSTGSLLKRSRAELSDLFKSIPGGKKTVNVEDAAAAAGIPNPKDFEAYLQKWRARSAQLVRKYFTAGNQEFRSPTAAAELTQKYFTNLQKTSRGPVQGLQAMFGAPSGGAPGTAGTMHITAQSVTITAGNVSGGTGTPSPRPSPQGEGGKATGGGAIPGSGQGALLESKEIIPASGGRRVQKKELLKIGEQIDTFFKEIDGTLEATKQVTTSSPLKKARDKFARQLSELNSELQKQLGGTIDPTKVAGIYRKQAEMLRALAGGNSGKELEKLGMGSLMTKLGEKASGYERRAGQLELRAARPQAQADPEEDRLRRERYRLRLMRGSQVAEEQAERKAAADALRAQRDRAKADTDAEKTRRKAADNMAKLAQGEALGNLSHGEANAALNALRANGFVVGAPSRSSSIGPRGRSTTETYSASKEDAASGQILTTKVRFNFENGKAVSADVAELNRKMKDTRAEAGALGGDFLRNTLKVTAWASSVAILYKSLELARFSMTSLIETGATMARLDQVFSKIGGSTEELTADVIGLAAANGRSAHDALDAAVQWSRLGLTRIQVNDAVRTSAMAANVGQVTMSEATERLTGIMMTYGLRVGDLRTVLGEFTALSNTTRVRVNELFQAFSRSAGIAKQAGLSWQELAGLSAETIARTGQAGGNVGNFLKTIIARTGSPDTQKILRDQFHFEATAEGGADVKNFSQLLAELYVRYQELSGAQRESMLYQVAGANQISKLSSMLDGYVRAQKLAIEAMLKTNTAELENNKIKATLKASLQGLTAEWEKFVVVQGNRGPVQALHAISSSMQNVLKLMNTPLGGGVVTGFLAVLTLAAAKAALVGVQMKSLAGSPALVGGTNYIAASRARAVQMAKGLNDMTRDTVMNLATRSRRDYLYSPDTLGSMVRYGPAAAAGQVPKQLFIWGEAASRAGVAMRAAGTSGSFMFSALGAGLKTLSMATAALTELLVPLLLLYGAYKLFTLGMEIFGQASERTQAQLAGFNAEAEKAAESARAFAQTAQLLQTVGRALPNLSGSRRAETIDQTLEATVASEPDEAKRGRRLALLRAEFSELEKQGNVGQMQLRLEDLRLEKIKQQAVARRQQIDAEAREMVTLRARLASLDEKDRKGYWFATGRNEERTKLQGQLQSHTATHDSLLMDDADSEESFRQHVQETEKYQTALERTKDGLQTIREIYRSLAPNTAVGRAQFEIMGNEAQLEALQKEKQALEERQRMYREANAEREQYVSAIGKQIEDKKTELGAVPLPASIGADSTENDARTRHRKQLLDEIAKLQDDQERLRPRKSEDAVNTESRLEQLRKEAQQLRVENAGLKDEANMARRDASDRLEFGQRLAQMSVTPSDVGVTEIDKALNKKAEIERQLSSMDEASKASIQGRAKFIELENQLYHTQWEIRQRVKEAEKEINQIIIDRNKEFRNSLLMAGPGEMLRKLAAMRINQSGPMAMGQFLSLSPNMRGDLQQLQPGRFDPRVWDLRNGINNAGPQKDEWAFYQSLQQIQKAMAEAALQFKNMPGITEVGAASMELALQARNAASALGQLPGIVQQIMAAAGGRFTDDAGDTDLPMDGQMKGLTVGK